MNKIVCISIFSILSIRNVILPAKTHATSIDGDVDSSSFTFSGPVTISSLTVSNTFTANILSASTGTLGSFMVFGTTTNDNAPLGRIGESTSTFAGPTAFPSSASFGDLTSISLTSGDWDLSAVAFMNLNSAALTSWGIGLSTTTGNSTAGLILGDNRVLADTGLVRTQTIPAYRMSLSSATRVYLKYSSTYTGGPPNLTGRLSARRIR